MKTTISLLTKAGLSLLLAACIFNGCASWPTEGPSGTFTITGIPAEYEGKFVMSSLYIPPEKKAGQLVVFAPKEIARGHATAITNSELKLPLYGKEGGYFASEAANVCLRIGDTAKIFGSGNGNFDFVFAEVQFEEGVKEVKWDDQVAHGFVTLTNIPAGFAYTAEERGSVVVNQSSSGKTGSATVYIGHPDYDLKVITAKGLNPVATGAEATCSVYFKDDGMGTGKFLVEEYYNYRSFDQSGTRDVIVLLDQITDLKNPSARSYPSWHFKAAPIQDGKIILDFSKGVRQ